MSFSQFVIWIHIFTRCKIAESLTPPTNLVAWSLFGPCFKPHSWRQLNHSVALGWWGLVIVAAKSSQMQLAPGAAEEKPLMHVAGNHRDDEWWPLDSGVFRWQLQRESLNLKCLRLYCCWITVCIHPCLLPCVFRPLVSLQRQTTIHHAGTVTVRLWVRKRLLS